ncbi:hypothetical protein [Natrarchaeobius oligotrophus]|uniref:Uncharacterized protein n=1 Tax=Natrarchaeobius chitinivorans TaxID=1679083 RepID=A0A3N6PS49_NATCH|nr:hypothetical protein [Natrarchaeobius chitinivorans]RQH02296.1 hypothetical protein EA472_03070 [Natrarchaeobius chitinivorans]
MTGMKEGAGENPFADDPAPVESTESRESSSDDSDRSNDADDAEDVTETTRTDRSSSGGGIQIPYKYRRDGVQDGRDRVPLFLHEETKTAERDALRELEDRFDDDVSLTDLREALVKVGVDHLDEVEDQLEEWGYGITFDD